MKTLSEKDRILIPEKEGESFYWKKEKDVEECFNEISEEIENVRTFDRTPYEAIKDIKQIIKNKVGEEE